MGGLEAPLQMPYDLAKIKMTWFVLLSVLKLNKMLFKSSEYQATFEWTEKPDPYLKKKENKLFFSEWLISDDSVIFVFMAKTYRMLHNYVGKQDYLKEALQRWNKWGWKFVPLILNVLFWQI